MPGSHLPQLHGRELMNTETRRVQDITVGDTVKTWFGFRRVNAIEPYHGPHDFVIGTARFDDGTGMTMCDTDRWEVVTAARRG